jgi:IclR family pca regulon transcriptional regulator
MTQPDAARPREAVGPLIRGLCVLRGLAEAGGRQGAGDLVRHTGLARATVDRIVRTLERIGYVRSDGRDVLLAPRVMELGNAYLAAGRLSDLLGPLTDRLAEELDESVTLTIPDRDGVRSIRQATRARAMSVTFRVGELFPAERGAGGALFAAAWSEDEWRRAAAGLHDEASFAGRIADARRNGWSLEDRLEPGLVAVAMPVRDGSGRTVCAVSVVSHTSRYGAESLRTAVLPRLRRTASAMEDALAAGDLPAGPAPRTSAANQARASKQELGADFLESLARGLSVLTALGDQRADPSLGAVAEATGLARATARRALITLTHLGYVTSEGGRFRPAPQVLDLGFAQMSGLTLPEIAQPHLTELAGRVNDSASMAVLTGDDIRYVARVPTVRIMSVDITVGTRFPAHATSMGRVLLAGLPPRERAARLATMDLTPLTRRTVTSAGGLGALLDRTAREGYSLVEEELEEGLRSIAVPVRDRGGDVLAAINVSMHASRRTAEQARESVLPALRDAAARIEEDLHVAGRYVRIRTA